MSTTINNAVENNNVLIFANYYVSFNGVDASGNELPVRNINTRKGGFDPSKEWELKALNVIKQDPSRLLSRPTLSTGEKLYVSDTPTADINLYS